MDAGRGARLGERRCATLVVRQTEEVHERIGPLLVALKASLTNKDQTAGVLIEAPVAAEARRRIETALATPVSLEFQKTPLLDVAEQLEVRYALPVRFDRKALEDAGIQTDQAVTFQVKNVPLGSALAQLLDAFELEYLIKDERLVITTPEKADAALDIRVYQVGKPYPESRDSNDAAWLQTHPEAVKNPGSAPAWHFSPYRRLFDAILKNVEPQSWDATGGPARMSVYEPGQSLVVLQTRRGHEKVADLLAQLREATKDPKKVAAPAN